MAYHKSAEQYIEYHGDLEDNFNRLIDRPQFWETEEGFCGRLKDNKLWFYKRYPLMTNSFRAVLYGTVIDDHRISYRYGKGKGVLPFVLFADVIFFLFFAYSVMELVTTGSSTLPFIAGCISVAICTLLTALCLIYPKDEREALYQQLKKICDGEGRSWEEAQDGC